MKKFGILALAALLVVAFTVPAMAVESSFGGYWRTRFITQQNFSGDDSEAQDLQRVDTRTRLYYTATFHENLKFVNKFEFDAVWGDQGYGDIGADGVAVEVKNSYADFNLGDFNFKVGVQGATLARGFLFSDDFAGSVITYKGETFAFPFIWIKAYEGGMGLDANDADYDYYAIAPVFSMGICKINPYMLYAYSDNAGPYTGNTISEIDVYYIGLDLDFNFDGGGAWFTGIINGGESETPVTGNTVDRSGYLLGAGGNMDLGPVNIYGQIFYATGDDGNDASDDDSFFSPAGSSYYWSEIMGFGIFDQQDSANSPDDNITNILAFNLGVAFSPMEKMKVNIDLWNASLDEPNVAGGDDDLGTEVDLKITYKLLEGLNLDLVGAYLFAGDGTYKPVAGEDEDPYELGARLSLSF
jgi:hypothetical protein